MSRAFPPIKLLLGVELNRRQARVARVLDVALDSMREVFDSDTDAAGIRARERAAACLWVVGAYDCEPDEAVFAWLVRKGLDVAGEPEHEILLEAAPVGPEPEISEDRPVSDRPPWGELVKVADRRVYRIVGTR